MKKNTPLSLAVVCLILISSAGITGLASAQATPSSPSSSCPADVPSAGTARVYKNGIVVPYSVSQKDYQNLNEALAAVPSKLTANYNEADLWRIELGAGWMNNNVRSILKGANARCALKDNGQPDQVSTNVVTYKDKGPSFCQVGDILNTPSKLSATAATNSPQCALTHVTNGLKIATTTTSIVKGKSVTTTTYTYKDKDPSFCQAGDIIYTQSLTTGTSTRSPQCSLSVVTNGLKIVTPTLVTNTAARAPRYCAPGDIVTATRYGLAFDVSQKENLTINSACGDAFSEGELARAAKDAYEASYIVNKERFIDIDCNSLVDPTKLNSAIRAKSCPIKVPSFDDAGRPVIDPTTGKQLLQDPYIISIKPKKMNAPYARCVYTNPDPRNGIGGYYNYELGGSTLNVDRGCSATFTVDYLLPAPPQNGFVPPTGLKTAVIPGLYIHDGKNIAVENLRIDGAITVGTYYAPTPTATEFVRHLICGSWDGTEKYCWMGDRIDTFTHNDTDLVAQHDYYAADGTLLVQSSCTFDPGYPANVPPPGGAGYYAASDRRLVVGNGCIGSFDVQWTRLARNEAIYGNQNLVIFNNYVDASRLSGETWDKIDGQSLFWVGSASVNWAGDRRIKAIDGIVISQGNKNIVLMENKVTRANEGVKFLERGAFDSGDAAAAPSWDEDKTLLVLGNAVTKSEDSGLLFYGGGKMVLAQSERDKDADGLANTTQTTITGNKRYGIRLVKENLAPSGQLVTTQEIIQSVTIASAQNGKGILGLNAMLDPASLAFNHPPRFNLADIDSWKTDNILHLAAIDHQASSVNSEEKLVCNHPVVEDEDELVTEDLADNPVVTQLPGVTPNILSLVEYHWFAHKPGDAGFSEIAGQHSQDLDLAGISPVERVGLQYKCQVVLRDGIDRVGYFNATTGEGVRQAALAANQSLLATLIPAESVPFNFDSDGDGIPDNMDCAPTDSSKWQTLTYNAEDKDHDGAWVNTTVPQSVCTGAALPEYTRAAPLPTDEVADIDDSNPDVQIALSGYKDLDQDGFGAGSQVTIQAKTGTTMADLFLAATGGDCNDNDPQSFPGKTADFIRNGSDQNCDGQVTPFVEDLPHQCGDIASGATTTRIMYKAAVAISCLAEAQTATCTDGTLSDYSPNNFDQVTCQGDTTLALSTPPSLSPTTNVHTGDSITCSVAPNSAQAASLTYSFSWNNTSGGITTSTPISSTYTVTAADRGKAISCLVVASDSSLNSTSLVSVSSVTPVNTPPTVMSVTLSGGNHVGDTLSCTAPANDLDNDPTSLTLSFSGTSGSAVGGTYQITYADLGSPISCSAKANDGQADSATVAAQTSVTPVPRPPVISSVVLMVKDPFAADQADAYVTPSQAGSITAAFASTDVKCVAVATDADGGPSPALSYSILVNGNTSTLSELTLPQSGPATTSAIDSDSAIGSISCAVTAQSAKGLQASLSTASQRLEPASVCDDGSVLAGAVPNVGADGQPVACRINILPWQGDTTMFKILNKIIILVASVAPSSSSSQGLIGLQNQFVDAINKVMAKVYPQQSADIGHQGDMSPTQMMIKALDLISGTSTAEAATRTRVTPGVVGDTSLMTAVLSVSNTASSGSVSASTESTIVSSITGTTAAGSSGQSGSGGSSGTAGSGVTANQNCSSGVVVTAAIDQATLDSIAQFNALLGQLSSPVAQTQLACSYTTTTDSTVKSSTSNITQTLVSNKIPTSSQTQVAQTLTNQTAAQSSTAADQTVDQTSLINQLLATITNLQASLQTAINQINSDHSQTIQQALQNAIQDTQTLSGNMALNTTDVAQVTCYADLDGDGRTGTAKLVNLQANTGTASQECPSQVYQRDGQSFAYSSVSDQDCNDKDPTAWQPLSYQAVDKDQDGYFVSATGSVCSGNTLPAGYRATGLAAGETPDSDDNDPSVQVLLSGYLDIDGDGRGAGALVTRKAAASATLAAAGLSADNTDCDDTNPAHWQLLSFAARDQDQDGYFVNASGSVCSGNSLPAGYRSTTLAAGEVADINDNIKAVKPSVSNTQVLLAASPISAASAGYVGASVSCLATASDVYSTTNLQPTYQILLSPATGQSQTIQLTALAPSYTVQQKDKGATISCQASVTDPQGMTSDLVTSALPLVILNAPPVPFAIPAMIASAGSGKVADSLSCYGQTTDPDDSSLTYTVTWKSSSLTSSPIKVETITTSGPVASNLTIAPSYAHSNITCDLSASDGSSSVKTTSAAYAVQNSAPSLATLQATLSGAGTPVTVTLGALAASVNVVDYASAQSGINSYDLSIKASDVDLDSVTIASSSVSSTSGAIYQLTSTGSDPTAGTSSYHLTLPRTLVAADSASISFTLGDGHGGSSQVNLAINVSHVQPAPPSLQSAFDTSIQGSLVGYAAKRLNSTLLSWTPPDGLSVSYAVTQASQACTTDQSVYSNTAPTANSAAFTSKGDYKVCVREVDPLGNVAIVATAAFHYDNSLSGVRGNIACQASTSVQAGGQAFSASCVVSGYSDPGADVPVVTAATAYHACANNLAAQSTDGGTSWTISGNLANGALGCNLLITLSDGTAGEVAQSQLDLVRSWAAPASLEAVVDGPTISSLKVLGDNNGSLQGWNATLSPLIQRPTSANLMTSGFHFFGVSQ